MTPGVRPIAGAGLRRDLRLMMRDGFLILIILVPIIASAALGLLYRFLLPFFADFSQMDGLQTTIAGYLPLLNLFFILLPAIMTGMGMGFLLLEEKEQGIAPLWAISVPGPMKTFLLRLPLISLLYLCASWGARICFAVAAGVSFLPEPVLMIMGLVQVPLFALILAGIAGNRVQGLAVGKFLSFFEMAPLAAYFLSGWTRYIFAPLPPFWMAEYLLQSRDSHPASHFAGMDGLEMGAILLLGLAVHTVWLILCFRSYRKKLF